jgi:hypothetical protein
MRCLLLIVIVVSLGASAQQTRVLFLGNSYTTANDLPDTFRQLALSLGDTVITATNAPGGYTLEDHAGSATSLDLIASQPWEFMVMQEQSQLGALPADITNTESSAIQLMEAMEANYECTYPVLYMTWGRENGDDLNCPNFPYMCTYSGMQQALMDNYVALAMWNDAHTAPVGAAWKVVRETHPEIQLYQTDGSHPSIAGTYLAACVFYSTFFQESCVNATFHSSLDPATAAILRNIASNTVLNDIPLWNLDQPNGTSALLHGFTGDANSITLIHHGQGTHLWTCTNGESFTTATATFTFTTSNTYYVTHIYDDPCGNSDTASFTFNIVVGLEEHPTGGQCDVRPLASGQLEIKGMEIGGSIMLFDAQGRVVHQQMVDGTTQTIACPMGLHLWRIVNTDGSGCSGSVFVH